MFHSFVQKLAKLLPCSRKVQPLDIITGLLKQVLTSHFGSEAHSENQFNKFEVLIGDPCAIRWVTHSKSVKVQELNATPVEGGIVSKNGTPLYITRVRYDGGVHPAKAGVFFNGSILAFGGKEVAINVSYGLKVWSVRNVLTGCLQDYEILCLK